MYDTFTLGGPVSVPGFNLGELRGSNYWSGQASFLRRIADLSYVFGQALYAGLNFTVADIDDRIGLAPDDPVYSTGLVLTGRTPLGPVALSLAVTSESDGSSCSASGARSRNARSPTRSGKRRRAGSGHGEYQIGDVHARSCCFIGTSALIFTPKRTWSYAVQRGVGISITRA